MKKGIKKGGNICLIINLILIILLINNLVIAEQLQENYIDHGKELGFNDDKDLSITKANIDKNIITLTDPGSIKYNHNGQVRIYDGIDKGGKFIFKDKKLVEATFIATKDSEYIFQNHKINVIKGSKIEFKDGNVKINLPANSEVKKPVRIAEEKDDKDATFEFIQDKKSTFTIDGKKFSSPEGMKDGEIFSVKFDNKLNEFYTDGKLVVDNIEIGTRITKKMFILSKVPSSEFQGSYIALEENKLSVFSQKGEVTSSVRLLSGNKYVNIPSNGELLLQARALVNGNSLDKSLITIEPRKDQTPLIKTQGGFTIISGNKMIMYDSDMKSLRADPITSDNFKDKKSAIVQISSSMSNGDPIKYTVTTKDDKGNPKTIDVNVNFDLITSEDSSVISVNRGSDTETLSRLSLNSLTAIEKQKLLSLSNEKRNQVLSSSNPKEELKKLTEVKIPEIKNQNPNPQNQNTPPKGIDTFSYQTFLDVNSVRRSAGRPDLILDPVMSQKALEYSKYMSQNSYFQHSRMGYAENIAMSGVINGKSSVNEVAKDFSVMWRDSPGHYSNIVNSDYKKTGIGVYFDGRTWWATQIFSR